MSTRNSALAPVALGVAVCLLAIGCDSASEVAPPTSAEAFHFLGDAVGAGPRPWTHLRLEDPHQELRFAVIGDRTGGARPEVFRQGIRKLNLLRPEFVMSVGDLITGHGSDEEITGEETRRRWAELRPDFEALEMPFFLVPGNNDLTSAPMLPVWREQYGRPYWAFRYRGALFVALSSEDPPRVFRQNPYGQISPEQLEWLEQTLDDHRDARWTFVFLHRPMWLYPQQARWLSVQQLLADRPHTVFAGHHHTYQKTDIAGHGYYGLATTGGGSALGGVPEGQFDHVAWVTLTETGPRIANLLLDGIWGDDPPVESLPADAFALKARAVGVTTAIDDRRNRRASGGTAPSSPAPLHPTSLSHLGYELLTNQRFDEAIALFALWVEEDPESVDAWVSLGDAKLRAGRPEQATAALERALELKPGYWQARAMLESLDGAQGL